MAVVLDRSVYESPSIPRCLQTLVYIPINVLLLHKKVLVNSFLMSGVGLVFYFVVISLSA